MLIVTLTFTFFSLTFSQMSFPQSHVRIGMLGSYFHSPVSGDWYNNLYTDSFGECAQWCNTDPLCRSFDYNFDPRHCRFFQVEPTEDQIGYNPSFSSQLGYVEHLPEFYGSFSQSCDKCTNNRYLVCISGTCQCTWNTFWNGTACQKQKYAAQVCAGNQQCRDNPYGLTCNLADVCSSNGWTCANCFLRRESISF